MPTTPEPRFEVPPEYAEVYERAYRRAYEQGLGVPESTTSAVAPTAPKRGRRVAVPRQRSASEPQTASAPSGRGGARRAGVPTTSPEPPPAPAETAEPSAPREGATGRRPARRHRGIPRTGSTWVPLLVLIALALMLIAGAFVLGRVTADDDLSTAPAATH